MSTFTYIILAVVCSLTIMIMLLLLMASEFDVPASGYDPQLIQAQQMRIFGLIAAVIGLIVAIVGLSKSKDTKK